MKISARRPVRLLVVDEGGEKEGTGCQRYSE
jgi:hypothetical protein